MKNGYDPDLYKRMPDPYITLVAAGAVTKRSNLGTCIALPAEHNPILLAKAVASSRDFFLWSIDQVATLQQKVSGRGGRHQRP